MGATIAILTDDNGVDYEFTFESFSFYHECLTLGVCVGKRPLIVAARK